MGCAADIRRMLEPLGVYSMEGCSGGEIEALGHGLDQAETFWTDTRKDFFPETAGEQGLAAWESLFSMYPAETEAERRKALEKLLKTDDQSFTMADIRETLAGCGIAVTMTEQSGMSLLLTVQGTVSMDSDPVFLMWALEQVLPCHLLVTCAYSYVSPTTRQTVQEQLALSTLRQRTRGQWENLLGVSG